MGTEQTAVGKQATQEQIFIECFDVFEDSMNVVEGLVERLNFFLNGNALYWI